MPRLKKVSLAEQLSDAIERDIRQGLWSGLLPGYRALGKRYGVSRPTCEAALRILEQRRLVGPAVVGRGREVTLSGNKIAPARSRQLLVVTDRLAPPPPDSEERINSMVAFWHAEGGETHRVAGDLIRSRRPASLLKRWIRKTGADCLLLYLPTGDWVRAAEQTGLPCYAMGGELEARPGRISSHSASLPIFLDLVLREALEIGHRRILIPCSGVSGLSRMQGKIQEKVDKILAEIPDPHTVEMAVAAPGLTEASDWHRWWAGEFACRKSSLVILPGVFEAVSLHGYCQRAGIEMPADLSMIVLADTPLLDWLDPPPTRYRFPSEKALQHFRNWVRTGFPEGSTRLFAMEKVKGRTYGPPAGATGPGL